MNKRVTAPDILAAKGQRKIAVITASDYPSGLLADNAGADMVLVGDSLAMVALGYEDTLSVTLDDMLHHTRAVARGVSRALVVGDMPFMSYQISPEQAVESAGRFLQQAGARAVKLEGGRHFAPHAQAIAKAGIPVMGHIGLTPQFVAQLGGFKAQGKTAAAAAELVEDALAMQRAGCFALVLEVMPQEVAAMVTEALSIPTIGIGAGPRCDGQVLVQHDLLGTFERFIPRFVKRYAELGKLGAEALAAYCADVREARFPGPEHSLTMDADELARLKKIKIKKQ